MEDEALPTLPLDIIKPIVKPKVVDQPKGSIKPLVKPKPVLPVLPRKAQMSLKFSPE